MSIQTHDIPADYEVLAGPLGGGMGHVYKCRHKTTGTLRAIKVIRPELLGGSQTGIDQQFVREAQALEEITHPAIVRSYGIQGSEGHYCLAMEFVEGPSLRDQAQRAPLPASEVFILASRLLEGLAAAHERGIVHRDISPDNIVMPGGRPAAAKLIDFGVASGPTLQGATLVGDFKGKLGYASPEQFGLFNAAVTDRSDLYSLGLVLLEVACPGTLTPPSSFYDAIEVRRRTVQLPATLPPELASLLAALLQPDPRDRPSAAQLLSIAHSTSAATVSPRQEARASDSPNPLVLGISAVATGIATGIALFLWNA